MLRAVLLVFTVLAILMSITQVGRIDAVTINLTSDLSFFARLGFILTILLIGSIGAVFLFVADQFLVNADVVLTAELSLGEALL